jgi:DNA-directed RNA polymerase subunit beta'
MTNVKNNFDSIKINLASPERIKHWGQRTRANGIKVGEITKYSTLNTQTLKPEMGGLFCEEIFGPIKNWECHCGNYKYKKPEKILICEFCGVEVTESSIRRHRMGYIELRAPVVHVWYLKGVPRYLSILLKKKLKEIEEIIYFNIHLFVHLKNRANPDIPTIDPIFNFEMNEYQKLHFLQINKTHIQIGAEAIEYLLNKINLEKEIRKNRLSLSLYNSRSTFLCKKKQNTKFIRLKELIRRIRIIENFLSTGSKPNWMILKNIPVLPAGLRPMILLDNGKYISSDLNELYRRVITRNNRLGYLLKTVVPSIVVYNEKRMLQESIDALIDNGKHGAEAVGVNNKVLKSLADIIRGKHGRFRQNLLGKRVDYSARSVIIVGPTLKLNQCGLPHEIAMELFQPFVVHHLIINGLAKTPKNAINLITNGESNIWIILKSLLKGYPILLNRAPTLHRLGIQSFEPILVAGRAIQLHPLVCNAFNADFDGDQMAIHIPLSFNAQDEAKKLMFAPNNFLSPATGQPIILPSQDMVLGCYYLSVDNLTVINLINQYFANITDVLLAYGQNKLKLHTPIWLRTDEIKFSPKTSSFEIQSENVTNHMYIRTTPGRILLHNMVEKNLYL